MNRALKIALTTTAAFIVAALVVENFRHQWETEQTLSDLQKQVSQNAAKAAGATASAPAPTQVRIVTDSAPAGGGLSDYVEKQENILKVMQVGWALIDKRNPDAARTAVEVFQDGLNKIDGASPDLYNGLGRALLIAGRPRDAIVAWRKGLTYAPKLADMQSGIGWGYWNLHDPYHAKQAWEAAVAIDPKCADAWSALAWIDMATGDKPHAMQGFQALIAFDNRRAEWTTGLAMARAGNRDLAQIGTFFPMPPLEAFAHPPAEDPAATSAAASATAPTS